jgi:hypothetical protein
MGAHTSKSSAMGAGKNATVTENPQGYAGWMHGLGGLAKLESGARSYEIRDALEKLPSDSEFFTYRIADDGTVSGYEEVRKLRNGDFRVYGQDESGKVTVNKEFTASELARKYDGSGASKFHSEMPDTSSKVSITNNNKVVHEGMTFTSGTYDIIKGGLNRARKYSEKGKVTTYDGQQFGVAKRDGKYFTTHIATGMAVSQRGASSWSEVAEHIKAGAEIVRKKGTRFIEESTRRLNKTLRGD